MKVDIDKLQKSIEDEFHNRFCNINYKPAYETRSIEGYFKNLDKKRKDNEK